MFCIGAEDVNRDNTHLCLTRSWQSQYCGLGHWQTALVVVHAVGHVSSDY